MLLKRGWVIRKMSLFEIPSDFLVFRWDRCEGKRGGGVLALVHKSLNPIEVEIPNSDNINLEVLVLDLLLPTNEIRY